MGNATAGLDVLVYGGLLRLGYIMLLSVLNTPVSVKNNLQNSNFCLSICKHDWTPLLKSTVGQ
jgi:hypothetical protein